MASVASVKTARRARRARIGIATVILSTSGLVSRARAEAIYELVPDVAVGITDNALATTTGSRVRDEFGTVGVGGQIRYVGARGTQSVGDRVSYTHFFEGLGRDTVSNTVSWLGTWDPSAVLELRLSAHAAFSRISGVDPGDLSLTVPAGTLGGSSQFLTTTASESLVYRPTPRRTYTETVSASRLQFLTATGDLPPATTLIDGELRAEFAAARDTLFIDARLADSFVPTSPTTTSPTTTSPTTAGTFSEGHNFLGQLLLGWRRQLSVAWTSELQAGPMVVFKPNGDGIVAPSGMAAINYQGRPWFATLSVAQSPAANLYIGEATISDQALARVALPLTRRETFFVTGFASYTYARAVGGAASDGALTRLFDQITGGAALTARAPRHPFWGALTFTIVDQRGSTRADRTEVPDLLRRTAMLSVGGAFAWGPGTPQLFGGGL